MSPNALMERETHRARALAAVLADVRVRLADLEATQRAMVAAGCEPRHVLPAEAVTWLETWFGFHSRRVDWRLRHPGQSHHHAAVVTAKRRAWRLYDAGGF